MIHVEISLYGFLRNFEPSAKLTLELPAGSQVADLRGALAAHGAAYWPNFPVEALRTCAFASERALLREGDLLPADGRVAVLPPVSGG